MLLCPPPLPFPLSHCVLSLKITKTPPSKASQIIHKWRHANLSFLQTYFLCRTMSWFTKSPKPLFAWRHSRTFPNLLCMPRDNLPMSCKQREVVKYFRKKLSRWRAQTTPQTRLQSSSTRHTSCKTSQTLVKYLSYALNGNLEIFLHAHDRMDA